MEQEQDIRKMHTAEILREIRQLQRKRRLDEKQMRRLYRLRQEQSRRIGDMPESVEKFDFEQYITK